MLALGASITWYTPPVRKPASRLRSTGLVFARRSFMAPSSGDLGESLDGADQEVGLEGLDEPPLRAERLRALDHVRAPLRGQHHHGDAVEARLLADRLEELDAVHARHRHV